MTDRVHFDKTSFLKFRFEGVTRPDYVYYGLGPRALELNRSRYTGTSFEETIGFSGEPRPGNVIETYVSVRNQRFHENGYLGDDPALSTQILLDRLPDAAGHRRVHRASAGDLVLARLAQGAAAARERRALRGQARA